ncbi:MAG: hypothetical protein ACLU0O_11040 [Collinsella sp.]
MKSFQTRRRHVRHTPLHDGAIGMRGNGCQARHLLENALATEWF